MVRLCGYGQCRRDYQSYGALSSVPEGQIELATTWFFRKAGEDVVIAQRCAALATAARARAPCRGFVPRSAAHRREPAGRARRAWAGHRGILQRCDTWTRWRGVVVPPTLTL